MLDFAITDSLESFQLRFLNHFLLTKILPLTRAVDNFGEAMVPDSEFFFNPSQDCVGRRDPSSTVYKSSAFVVFLSLSF